MSQSFILSVLWLQLYSFLLSKSQTDKIDQDNEANFIRADQEFKSVLLNETKSRLKNI